MYLDSCVTVDESKGYSTVNYDRVSMILSGCYTKEEADTSSMFYSYMTYNSMIYLIILLRNMTGIINQRRQNSDILMIH